MSLRWQKDGDGHLLEVGVFKLQYRVQPRGESEWTWECLGPGYENTDIAGSGGCRTADEAMLASQRHLVAEAKKLEILVRPDHHLPWCW